MFKNNLLALITHLLCIVISVLAMMPFIAYSRMRLPILPVVSLLLCGLYFLMGTKLKPQETFFKNILSISSIGWIGFILYGLFLVKKNVLFQGLIQVYSIPLVALFTGIPDYTGKSIIDHPLFYLFLLFVFIVLMGLGLELKRKQGQNAKQHFGKIYIGCWLFFILVAVGTNIFNREIFEVKFNYQGEQVFEVEKYLGKYYLYCSDLKLRSKKLIYQGSSYPDNVLPNPQKDLVLFTYEIKKKGKLLPEQALCIYDCENQKYLYRRVQNISIPDDSGCHNRSWSPDGERFYFMSYNGFQVLNLQDMSQSNLTTSIKFPIKKGYSLRCFAWNETENKIVYSDWNQLFVYDTISKSRKQMTYRNGYFVQAYFLNNDHSLLLMYVKEVHYLDVYVIEIFDMETGKIKKVYESPEDSDDVEGEGNGVEINYLAPMGDDNLVFSEYERDDDGFWDQTTIYTFNVTRHQKSQIFQVENQYSSWDFNANSKKLVIGVFGLLKVLNL